ncbi:hypothetical protein NA57DRAFT_36305 [Rhizodiscina lignyota]|uniref:Solute carrier family 40 member n=1 Tax=Rhizodiscina lignyota TaxID=1504668 RepID=A0A9P4IG09_9PEZI|nr:hypothetical protein NA57DRAFT_36305 [Rhizodiscina lignyota]
METPELTAVENIPLLEVIGLQSEPRESPDGSSQHDDGTPGSHSEDRTGNPSGSVKLRLYLSHFLSTWNSRVFEFGAVLYLASIFPSTLLPMSVYAVARAASAILFSPAVGRYIDTKDRLHVVRLSIVIQRTVVAASCALFWLLEVSKQLPDYVQYLALSLLSLLACAEKLSSIMNLVSVEKDWVVVVAGDNMDALGALNAQMRRIDLACKLIGPLMIALIDGFSTKLAILVNLGMNVASVPVEYFAIALVYNRDQALRRPKAAPFANFSEHQIPHTYFERFRSSFLAWLQQLRAYSRHLAFLPSFAGATLYFTVLSFAGQMVTYLISAGYSSTYVGIARTASVILEIAATWAAPLVMTRIGPIRAGAWFSTWQTVCLAIGTAIFWQAPSSVLSASGLVVGTILSRVGLRGFELAVQIVVQEEVASDERGSFSAVEASWQNLFELCAFASTIIFSKPSQFHWPVIMSLIATCSASIMYAGFVRARRGHLVHLSDCVESKRRKRSDRGEEHEQMLEEA